MKHLIKNIVVCLSRENVSEYMIDEDIFPDPFLEAVTRAIEIGRKEKTTLLSIRPMAICWEKKSPKKQHGYNSYWALVNAGFYKKAELLREKFQIQYDVDLAREPIHGKYAGK